MVTIKSKREIELMKIAGRIVGLAHQEIEKHIKPGVSTYELDRIIGQVVRENDAIPSFKGYGGFPGSACTSVNEQVVHGIPSKQVILKEGDIIGVDIGAMYKGYHGDSAWSYAVGQISEEAQQLLDVTKQSLFEGLKKAKAGNRLSDISHAIQTYAESFGYSIVREFVGHGLGKQLHEDPQIPNYGLPGRGILLKAGMTFAIEPMVNMGRKEVKVLKDNWTTVTVDKSLSAHYEHSILITEGECIIFTTVKEES